MTEMVDIVNGEDNVIDTVSRKEAIEKVLRNRASKILVWKNGKLLIQKRKMNRPVFEGLWDIGVGETVQPGESYDEAAARGLKEELGLKNPNLKFLFKYKFTHPKAKRYYQVYEATTNEQIMIQKSEISEIKFVTKVELKKLVGGSDFTPSSEPIFNKYLEERDD